MGFRPASPEELRHNGESLSLRDDFKDVLANGHVIHGYSSASSIRMLMILATRDYSDTAPLLGFGTGQNAEVALRRTRDTYRRREAEGLDSITEGQYPESNSGLLTGGPTISIMDKIVWGGSLKIYQEGDEVVAWSEHAQRGIGRGVEARGVDAQAAMDALAEVWLSS